LVIGEQFWQRITGLNSDGIKSKNCEQDKLGGQNYPCHVAFDPSISGYLNKLEELDLRSQG